MRSHPILLIASTLLLCFPIVAQEVKSKPCIAADEAIYSPGVDGVKPPQPLPDTKAKNAPKIRGPFSLEIVVNGDGHVCSVRVLSASNTSSAQQAADYIAQNWTFKPATRQGKPVAVTFTTNFSSP